MESLHNYLPKDLVNIVVEYSKDRTKYDNVVKEYLENIQSTQKILFDEYYLAVAFKNRNIEYVYNLIDTNRIVYKDFVCLMKL